MKFLKIYQTSREKNCNAIHRVCSSNLFLCSIDEDNVHKHQSAGKYQGLLESDLFESWLTSDSLAFPLGQWKDQTATILECLLIDIVFAKERLWKRKCLNKDSANTKKDITPQNVFRVIFTKKKRYSSYAL